MAPISAIAHDVITTLHQLGYEDACFIGSFAGALHGNPRHPEVFSPNLRIWTLSNPYFEQDLDILFLGTSDTQEQIKHKIVNANRSFYRVRSTNPKARYKVLWYNSSQTFNPGTIYSPEYSRSLQTSIKIDIIVPPSMRIPPIPTNEIINFRIKGYPS